ncbi:putative leader peptide [Streptomyces viridiviolaceus]|uniref:Leader peptide n=1 Tax=Streptomyces viridiviolaceus TaxID=68282 RepID=A0ABW2DRE0_9ACTN|nr:putative leader peptide [Streptomyces viridiviolaceus]
MSADTRYAAPHTRAALSTEVTDVARAPHAVRLHSRPHIDLLRVAGALCRP